MMNCPKPARNEDANVQEILWKPLGITTVVVGLIALAIYLVLHPEEAGRKNSNSSEEGSLFLVIAETITIEGLIAMGVLAVLGFIGYLGYKLKRRPQVNIYQHPLE
ncbi:MAG: hypothetical protein KDA65_03785 [Planctomycetaceae bacterium]|nr:hypothetical protein [Planctomycetaceae bacterium]